MTRQFRGSPSRTVDTRSAGRVRRPIPVRWPAPFRSSAILGLLGFGVTFLGAWVPGPWLDEAATAHIVGYPVEDMARLWQSTDAIYAPYYLLMHAWTAWTGITPFWLRLPSCVAVGVGTAAMAAAGHAAGGRRAQVLYAAAFALLPRTTAMGIEGRPYALSSMFTAIALLSVVQLRRSRSAWWWPVLGLSMVGAVYAQLFAALPLAGLVLVGLVVLSGRSRLVLLATSAAAAASCVPLVSAAIPQRQQQTSWLGDLSYSFAEQAFVQAWFPTRWTILPTGGRTPVEYVAVALAVLSAVTVAVAAVAGRPLPRARLAMAAVPPAVAVAALWGFSVARAPVLLGRYLTPSAPFFAMLLAECLMALRPRLRSVMAVLLAAGSILLIGVQRTPHAKVPAQDYAFIAAAVHAGARNGDGLLFEPGIGPPYSAQSALDSARHAKDLYPQQFDGLVDIAQPHRAPLTFVLSADPPPVDLAAHRTLPRRIWLVTKNHQSSRYPAQLADLGFRTATSSSGPGHTVALWTRG